MRTTLNLDERLISELKRVSGTRTKAEAIHVAAKEFIYRRTVERIKALHGRLPLVDTWRTLRDLESRQA